MPAQKKGEEYEDFKSKYVVALGILAFLLVIGQVLLQQYIQGQESDSRMINEAGRQRMLSQRITKLSLLLIKEGASTDHQDRLTQAISLFEKNGNWLAKEFEALSREQPNHELPPLFERTRESFESILNSSRNLLQNPTDSLQLEKLLESEQAFLPAMDAVVGTLDKKSSFKLRTLKNTSLFFSGLILFLLLIEAAFIFWPSSKLIQHQLSLLKEKEITARKLARELSTMYESLERSYVELALAGQESEDFQLLAKTDSSGNFTWFSEQIDLSMEWNDQRPSNLFDWLKTQLPKEGTLGKIQEILKEGKPWNGTLKLTNESGDFIWLRIYLIPTLDQNGQTEAIRIIGTDITEAKETKTKAREIQRERLEKKLKEQQYRSVLILEGQEEERQRISRELHDGIGQHLTALKYSLDGVNTVKSTHEKNRLTYSKELLDNIIKEIRKISFNLTPVALTDYGLPSVLAKLAQEVSKMSHTPVEFENLTGFMSRLEPKIENNLYRIVQEAVHNATKYAEASKIQILLSHNPQFLHLEIRDDGKGFDDVDLPADPKIDSGNGLFNIRERTHYIHGTFRLDTAPGKGTSIHIEVPLEQN
ncbi:signal transduction histidine kinase [Algoriphagus aquaeductus]|uniref:histidine kinase n=1 Tax=Algoriphagus aquaeductus TaxID=475299 RepID=A0A326RLC5_9BACT|nr:ATP-binding protein [Algoriphagus aquaeductus]PZV79647.1 signal transduction histidine kinase [Algoriphagus aquaeductus]